MPGGVRMKFWTISRKMNLIIFNSIFFLTAVTAVINFFVYKDNLLESANSKLESDIQLIYEFINAK